MKSLLLATVLSLFTFGANAQQVFPIVDIALEENPNGGLDVNIRPDGPFDEIVSAIVFTIRWNTADATSLGTLTQTIPEAVVLPVTKSGGESDDNGYRYQIFAGFGQLQMNAWNTAFVGGQEMTIMTIPVNGGSSFEIVNDAWTGDIMNNGDFFISLNGSELTSGTNPIPGPSITGIIYSSSISTSATDLENVGSTSTVMPNPSNGMVQLQLTNVVDGAQVEVLNTLGQVVFTTSVNGDGDLVENYDLSHLNKGSYYFRVQSATAIETLPIVIE